LLPEYVVAREISCKNNVIATNNHDSITGLNIDEASVVLLTFSIFCSSIRSLFILLI
jgi:hypothetical protein